MSPENDTPSAPPTHAPHTLGAWRRSPEAAEERAHRHRMLTTQLTITVESDMTLGDFTLPAGTYNVGTPLTAEEADEVLRAEGYR